MAQGKQELVIRCVFAEQGESLLDLLKGCFRSFLYQEIQKNADI